jgi:uncharacterized protein (DUF1778 family)
MTRRKTKRAKEESLRIRMSSEHKAALTEAADREGLTLSAWLRRVGLQAAGYLPGAGAQARQPATKPGRK